MFFLKYSLARSEGGKMVILCDGRGSERRDRGVVCMSKGITMETSVQVNQTGRQLTWMPQPSSFRSGDINYRHVTHKD